MTSFVRQSPHQVNRRTEPRGDLLPPGGGALSRPPPNYCAFGDFSGGARSEGGRRKGGDCFPNSAEHFTFFEASRAGLRVGEALLQLLSFLCTNSQKGPLFYVNILQLGLRGEAGVYSAQRHL